MSIAEVNQDSSGVEAQRARRHAAAAHLADIALAVMALQIRQEPDAPSVPFSSLEQEACIFPVLQRPEAGEAASAALCANDAFLQTVAAADQGVWRKHLEAYPLLQTAVAICYGKYVLHIAAEYWPELPLDVKAKGAMYGLLVAMDRFDASRRVKFVTYAALFVKKGIQQAISKELGISLAAQSGVGRMLHMVEGFSAMYPGRMPTPEELDNLLLGCVNRTSGKPLIPYSRLAEVRAYYCPPPEGTVYLHEELAGGGERIHYVAAPEPNNEREELYHALGTLPDEEREAVEANFGIDGFSWHDVVERIGLDRAQELLSAALKKLQYALVDGGLDGAFEMRDVPTGADIECEWNGVLSDQELAELHKLNRTFEKVRWCCAKGMRQAEAAAYIGVSKQRVAQIINAAKQDGEAWVVRWKEQRQRIRMAQRAPLDEQILQKFAQGMTIPEIARELGMYRKRITGLRAQAGKMTQMEVRQLRAQAQACDYVKAVQTWLDAHPDSRKVSRGQSGTLSRKILQQ